MDSKKFKLIIEEKGVNYFVWWTIYRDFTTSDILKKYLGSPYKNQLIYFDNGDGNWASELGSWNDLGSRLVNNIYNNTFDLEALIEEHYVYGEKVVKKCDELSKKDFSKLNPEYVNTWFKDVIEDYLKLNNLGFVSVISDVEHGFLSEKLKEILRKKISKDKIQESLNKLIISPKKNIFWQEQKDLISLAIKYPDSRALEVSDDLDEHIKKYTWINFGYIGPAWDRVDFINRIEEIKDKGEVNKILEEHENDLLDIQKTQDRFTKELGLSPKEVFVFQVARDFSFVKNYRVGIRHYFCYLVKLVFEEFSKRLKMPVDVFYYANQTELVKLFLGEIKDYTNILSRKNFYCEYIDEKEFRIVGKKELNKIVGNFIQDEIKDVDKLKGQAAFLGKAQGRVKIVSGPQDIGKVEEGDILIAVYTDPNLLPAMKRAAAFVTEQGGITSHAAIVAREMKKPCVIGTKVATKVFKDNDLVEVDANQGVVRKI